MNFWDWGVRNDFSFVVLYIRVYANEMSHTCKAGSNRKIGIRYVYDFVILCVFHAWMKWHFTARLFVYWDDNKNQARVKMRSAVDIEEAWTLCKSGEVRVYAYDIEFLGLLVRKNGNHVNHDRVVIFNKWPKPKYVTDLRSSLELLQFSKIHPILGKDCSHFDRTLEEMIWR